MAKLLMVVNEDRFFLSHRKAIALAAAEKGYDVTIVTKDTGSMNEIRNLGLKTEELPINPTGMNPFQELKTFLFLASLFHHHNSDIVHNVGVKNILWGGLAARWRKVPGVVNAVSGLGGLFNDGQISIINRVILRLIRFASNRKGIKMIFQNNDDLDIMRSRRVVKESQIEFIKGSGVDLQEYNYCEPPVQSPVQIIFTGRMVKEKGVLDLIKAAELLRPQYEHNIRFILCGRSTPNKSGISVEELNSLCDGKYISYLGERSDIKELLAASHIMAFPSYYREGVPRSLIEATAIGRPIITCDSTGCRDVVDEGVNGFKVAPQNPEQLADRLKQLIESPELRLRMGKASRKKAEKEFSINTVIDNHLRIYDELLS